MAAYAKALVPLIAGLTASAICLAVGERELGVGLLLATVTQSGLTYAVPNER